MQIICSMILLLVSVSGFSDFEALLELKKGFQSDPSGKVVTSWDAKALSSDRCPLNWYGVTCSSSGDVTSIDLNGLGLRGNFSFPVIVGLRMLQNLSISNNQFAGTLSNIGSFKSLKYLDVSGNLFSGSLPSGIENLRNLVFVNLSGNNYLGGVIPSGFMSLDKLKYLDLQGNSFAGEVMSLFSQLNSVEYVDISRNNFSGSLDLGLAKSSFVSSIRYLNVSGNSLVGELFAHDGIPFFDSLEVFDASSNQLSGSVPVFSFVVSLKILRLQDNQLSASLPPGLLQESSTVLTELDLSLNQLEGPIGSITSSALEKLNLSSNRLSGSLPLKVGHCAIVDLSNNNISGDLSRIQNWGDSVEIIRLSSNSLTGTLPGQTCQFLRLTSLEVANNMLRGVLPFILGTYPELKQIDLSHNQLSGFLPSNLLISAKLTDLDLSNNNFSGSLPLQDATTAADLSLTNIGLSHNSLGGVLSEELTRFHNLVSLDLSYNNFEGQIPDGLPDSLKVFIVSANNLSGNVPENLRRFPDSAFHPGNALLNVPISSETPKHKADITLRKHGYHMKSSVKAALIIGLVVGAALLALVCAMFHFMLRKQHDEEKSDVTGEKSIIPKTELSPSNVIAEKNSVQENESSSSTTSTPSIKAKLPVSSSRFSLYSDSENSPSFQKEETEELHPESKRKDESLSSKVSLVSCSTSSLSNIQNSPNPRSQRTSVKLDGNLYIFDTSLKLTAEELSCAPAEAIGRSCHGTLYRAVLNSDSVLAVKWLREGTAKGRKEFAREIKKLGNINHPNLVSLQAYYWGPKEHEKLIISRYMDAPCLAFYLQEAGLLNLPPLLLENRLKITLDIASCLSYLHNEEAIPHGNLKSTNVLLKPPELTAHLTDYSFHRLITPEATSEQVLNAAALGYCPPEFASLSKPYPSLKSDVYAFGVILLELLTGKVSGDIVCSDPGVVELTEWVLLLVGKNRAAECFDPSIIESQGSRNPSRVLTDVLQVAVSCISPAPERPDMKLVYQELSRIVLKRTN
ncbi:PREDICTED: probable inactive receptor kinase At5g10020 isoform X1 [Camelina sativa]|uniref:Probable inactive receptor kinase At5g10020 isoform X1 n=1 Tax=Camelina sativa TaxID=90675 RepID=A0ABM0WM66_CAMSA|nr:PREDICTED: probable inactive receptor kinase At5g10020 isoform X1 [Camelina sativa]